LDRTFVVSPISSRRPALDARQALTGLDPPLRSVDDALFASLAPATSPPPPAAARLARETADERLLDALDAITDQLGKLTSAEAFDADAVELRRRVRLFASRVDVLTEEPAPSHVMEAVRRRMEEVRRILLAAARRGIPVEQLDDQVNELVEVVECLESGRTGALFARPRRPVQRDVAPSIEDPTEDDSEDINAPVRECDAVARRLHAAVERSQSAVERVETSLHALASKLDEPQEALAPLLHDLDVKLDAALARQSPPSIEPALEDIGSKLDRALERGPEQETGAIERELILIRTAVEAAPPPVFDREAAEQLIGNLGQRLESRFAEGVTAAATNADRFARLADRFEEAAGQLSEAAALQSTVRTLLERLQEESSKASVDGGVAERMSAFQQDRVAAERRIEALLQGIKTALDKAIDSLPREIARPVVAPRDDPARPPAVEDSPAELPDIDDGLRLAEILEETQRPGLPLTDETEDEFLLEPGAAAPHRALLAAEPAESARPRTNAAISAHIAAARRAAQSAALKNGDAAPAAGWGTVGSAVRQVKQVCARHKRSILIAAVVVLGVAAAATVIRNYGPLAQRFEGAEQPAKAAAAEPMTPKPLQAASTGAVSPAVDPFPTASISPDPARAGAPVAVPAAGALPAIIPSGVESALRDAALAGSYVAEYELAQRLFEGRGAPQDQRAAAVMFERAASSGFAPAQFKLGLLYQKGLAVERDPAAAKRWYTAAAQAGNARAAHNLGVMEADAADGKPDYGEASKWFRRAAEMGVRDSQFNLGVLCARGLGVAQNLGQAWMWFSLAAAQGDAEAARKRDDVAGKLDADSLAAAADQLSKFKPVQPDPSANDLAPLSAG
jgi:localization factor PodJL